jgi:hypothetical protein
LENIPKLNRSDLFERPCIYIEMDEFGVWKYIVGKEEKQTCKIEIGYNKTSSKKTKPSVETTKNITKKKSRLCWGAIFCLTQYKST